MKSVVTKPEANLHSKERLRSRTRSFDTSKTTRSSSGERTSKVKNLPRFVQKNLSYGLKRSSMSVIRRYFLFFVFLDLAVHLLAYLLYLKHAREFNLMDLVKCQMKCYDIQTSFVDIMMLAVVRFLILESAYGLGRSTSWTGTALTTAVTNVFIIIKPLHYDWKAECQLLLPVSLIALSFILAWLEAFLVDFQLIKMEKLAQKYVAGHPEILKKTFPRVGFFKSLYPITRDLFRNFTLPPDSINFNT